MGVKNPKIAEVLKLYRKLNQLTVIEVSDLLKERGIVAAPKTVYGWESGQTQPTADTLLVLCCIYGINEVLTLFDYKKTDEDMLVLSDEEKQIIRAYRRVPDMRQAVKKLLSISNMERQ